MERKKKLDHYYIISPKSYNDLEEYFGESILENILKYNTSIIEDEPYYGVGIMYFIENFQYVLDDYYCIQNSELYYNISNNEDIFIDTIDLSIECLYSKDFYKKINTIDVVIDYIVDTINNSNEEMENLKLLYILQKNIVLRNDICNEYKKNKELEKKKSIKVNIDNKSNTLDESYNKVIDILKKN